MGSSRKTATGSLAGDLVLSLDGDITLLEPYASSRKMGDGIIDVALEGHLEEIHAV